MLKKMYLWTILIVLFLSLTCLTNATTPKDALVIGANTEIFITNDPGVSFEVLPNAMVQNIYAKLVSVVVKDKQFITVPGLAESWEVAPDGKTWTFHLRKGLVFADGDPLKADAVVYSFQRVLKLQKSPCWLFSDVLGLTEESIAAPDDYTVKIVTNGAPSNVVLTMVGNTLSGVLNPRVVKEHEVDGDMGQAWLMDHSAGAGPYNLEEWDRKIKVVLKANENYWRGAPKIKTVILQDIPEPTDQLLLLKKGDIDVAWDLTAEQANSLKGGPDVSIVTTPGQSDEYVGMNAGWGPFKDVRVRQAVKYAIDYNAIIDKVMTGFAINNQQFLPVGYFGYVENNPYYQDIEKAKTLMAEAGYADGFDVEIVTNTTERRKTEAVVVQENLAKIGIRATINLMQASQMYAKFREQGLQIIVAGWGVDYPDADALSNPFANYRVKQLAWRCVWYDDYAADLTEAASKEINEDRRFQMYQDLTNYWHIYGPFAMMYQPIQFWGVRNEVKNYDKAAEGYSVHYDLTEVYK
ncbi:MAG: ABC transporter substrate-binding protein [Candidatus Infernicultor aquiphilus]|uniref:ABC transporter substrate-binding protein n=1 Tax=Candidatus Infernicultor aquiphilus TaxID=1805029 RepID=A0A2M8CAF9_9BACT|nr:ABC transporter substrate-binding protein [bacterium]PIW11260.1 MAG: ABC transporter substrate-binding protein [Candidatus Atribacteria bacterium CG17_big_fil_post_rev_8_21_14_2_50_34_11]PIX34275.1 MAG: ABC transporter substrate-binding protein [Candidatus Atribacteria bacterium CG_4_8_14_3_um_filter_34_18]PIY31799.1 MAG: ABC transporter substrate-binding protein [Candidatus Atribacteria bacterium CG_4_10_14_3_um_filter_34_13]PJB55988.1 MAG: ABC transporter substrate-binding protein [Candida